MDDHEQTTQQELHTAVEQALAAGGDLEPGDVLTGWILVWETATLNPERAPSAGHFYGPTEMTSWRALGLIEWGRITVRQAVDDENGDTG